VGASRLWWKRFVEKVSFEPGMKQWMCDGGWEWWAGGRWIRH